MQFKEGQENAHNSAIVVKIKNKKNANVDRAKTMVHSGQRLIM